MFQGSYVAIVTPFTDQGDIDYASLEALFDWHIAQGTKGIVVLGTTGEAPTITSAEREALIRFSVEKIAARVPVIIGTGTNDTRSSIALTEQAKSLGADAALVVTPYYNKPPQKALVAHFKAVAAVGLPVVVYNVPSRTGVDMLPESIMALNDESHIVAVKEATGDVARVDELKKLGCTLDILSGEDANVVPFMKAGGHGVVSVSANIMPKTVSQLCDALLNNDSDMEKQCSAQLTHINELLFCQSNPIPCKFALAKMGKIGHTLRMPLLELETEYHQRLVEELQALKLLEINVCN